MRSGASSLLALLAVVAILSGCAEDTSTSNDDALLACESDPTGECGGGDSGLLGHDAGRPVAPRDSGIAASKPDASAPATSDGSARDASVASEAKDTGAPGVSSGGGAEPTIPEPSAECPTFQSGTMNIMGLSVEIQTSPAASEEGGPLLFYWHGTGGSGLDYYTGFLGFGGLPQEQRDEIMAMGGTIVSPSNTTEKGDDVTVILSVWFTGDFEFADLVVACAVKQLNIDKRRIYTTGDSAGGLMSGAMVYGRSSYLAASAPNSGGIVPLVPTMFDDPEHVPPVMTMHGKQGSDWVIVDFSETSAALDSDIVARGGFAIDCDHGGGHVASPTELQLAAWQFMKDHPYGVAPEPYANGLPSSFPEYCEIVK